MGPMAKRPGHWRTDMHNSGADGTRGTNQRRHLKLCLPMGTMAANWKKRRLRYVAVFWAALRTSHCSPLQMGVPEIKNNRSHPLLCYKTRLIHLCRV